MCTCECLGRYKLSYSLHICVRWPAHNKYEFIISLHCLYQIFTKCTIVLKIFFEFISTFGQHLTRYLAWRPGVVVTALVVSTKLLYVEPG